MAHLGWVPASTSLVVAIDVDQLRRSRWWSSIAEPLVDALVLDAKRRTAIAAQCGLDPLRDREEYDLLRVEDVAPGEVDGGGCLPAQVDVRAVGGDQGGDDDHVGSEPWRFGTGGYSSSRPAPDPA